MEKSLQQVLREIFPLIDVRKVLDHYNVRYSFRGDELMVSCFFHEAYRGKADKNPSLSVNMKKKLYNCFSCPAKGNIYQLVMQLEINNGAKSCTFMEAVVKICEINNIDAQGIFKVSKDVITEDLSIDEIFEDEIKIVEVFNDSVLRKFYLKNHNYFLDRGFKKETLKTFEMGFGTSGLDKDRCVFPVRNDCGGLVGWTGRSVIKTVVPKWLHRPKERFHASMSLFNIDKALPYIIKTGNVYVVESVANCMRMWEAGFKNCVAIFGNSLSEEQASILCQYASHIFLLFDNDDGGADGVRVAVDVLYDKGVSVSIGQYDFGCDSKGYAYDIGDSSVEDVLTKISYIDINDYIERSVGVMKILDDDFEIKEPIYIETENCTVVLTPKIKKHGADTEVVQLGLDDMLYLKRLNNMFGVVSLEAFPALPF